MEHRCNHRKPLELDVVVGDRNLGIVRCKSKNISLNGMCIDFDGNRMNINTIVDISFPVNCGDQRKQCKAKAIVIHQGENGLGLMFSELESNVRQMLRKELYGYATVSQRAYLAQAHAEVTHLRPRAG